MRVHIRSTSFIVALMIHCAEIHVGAVDLTNNMLQQSSVSSLSRSWVDEDADKIFGQRASELLLGNEDKELVDFLDNKRQ